MSKKPKLKQLKKYIVYALCLMVLFCVYMLFRGDVSVETLLEYTPRSPLLAAAVILLMFALKSLTVFFPLLVLEVTVGYLFPAAIALAVNFAGLLIILTIPYWIGRRAGFEAVQQLIVKYPRFNDIICIQQDNSLFICFFLRVLGCLPGDIVTMYLGAVGTPFLYNLCAGALGLLPAMLIETFLGRSIQEPFSPAFWLSVSLKVFLSLSSALLYSAYRKKLRHSGALSKNSKDQF